MVPIPQAHDIKAMGSLPRIFDGDRTRAEAFLTEFLGYLILNQGVPGFESPIRQVTLALTLIKGEKVDLWVRNMIDTLRRLHPVHHNVPAVWDEFCYRLDKRLNCLVVGATLPGSVVRMTRVSYTSRASARGLASGRRSSWSVLAGCPSLVSG
jgi:hypothetical protein